MRTFLATLLILAASESCSAAQRFNVQCEWGFGPASSELYWDGTFQLKDGRILVMDPVSFERDRHDRLLGPDGFRSLTLNNGTDGLILTIQGNENTQLQLQSKQGTFQWSLAELIKQGELSFPSRSKGRLVVRLSQTLGSDPELLSDKQTQDSHPAICRLGDGRQLILWRAFLSSADKATHPPADRPSRLGTDQIRARVLDGDGSNSVFNLLNEPGDVESITVAAVGNSACQLVWAEQRQHNWDLFGCLVTVGPDGLQTSQITRLSRAPGVDKSPRLVRANDGSLVLLWQAWRDGHSSIFVRTFRVQQWSESSLRLSDQMANDWNPSSAASSDGRVAAAWSSWRNGSYDVHLRIRVAGRWGPVLAVASGEEFEAHPHLLFDESGVLWITYERGQAGWGMDSHTAGLRSHRDVQLRVLRNGRIERPTQQSALKLPDKYVGRSEMPHLTVDAHGTTWLFFRHLTGRGVWKLMGTTLAEKGWSLPAEVKNGVGGQDLAMASGRNRAGDLVVVYVADARTNQVGHDSHLYKVVLTSRDQRHPRLTSQAAAATVHRTTQKHKRLVKLAGNQNLSLFFGDLHRHTELSVCQTGRDGSLEDAYRYAIDAAELDFLCVTDHVQHIKVLNDFDFWRSGKTADLHRVAALHEPLYGYERSQRWPYGHRNIISPTRNPLRVSRTADNRPWTANQGYDGEQRIAPPKLWEKLIGQNVITIPHSSGSPIMGTNFGHRPTALEPVVEVYQGCRFSYEHANAPDPRPQRNSKPYGGAVTDGGSIWDALGKGYRYGFIASSDHLATHNSYTCVWAEDLLPASILRAISRRQCYAATDKIICDVRMGEHLMGAEFTAASVPPLEVNVSGTTHINLVDIIKDNRIVYTHIPSKPTAKVSFKYRDMQAKPGVQYYYPRVIQQDRNMAWVSPIWVNLQPTSAK